MTTVSQSHVYRDTLNLNLHNCFSLFRPCFVLFSQLNGKSRRNRCFHADLSQHFFFLDNLYGNNAASTTATSTDSTESGSNMGYGTFYPESSTYSSPPVSNSNSSTTKEESYQSMPPPADQESPYSYGYGEEKKKMLTQNEGQGGDYSMYSTAYPSSVTSGQGYNNYGE